MPGLEGASRSAKGQLVFFLRVVTNFEEVLVFLLWKDTIFRDFVDAQIIPNFLQSTR